MKLIIFATIISLTFSYSLFRTPAPVTPISDSPPQCASDYWTSLFAYFELDKPTQLLDCFNDASATLYFKHISEVADLSVDVENRNNIAAHWDIIKLTLIDKALKPLWGCIGQTQDWSDLLEALGAKERNPKLFELARCVYFQSDYAKLSSVLPPVVNSIDSSNFTCAGEQFASFLDTVSNDIKKKGLALLGLKGLWNGVHMGLGLPDAKSIETCWDNDTAHVRLEFVYQLAKYVANGSPNEAAVNTENWYKNVGHDILGQIPAKNWQCWEKADDTQQESSKLGMDITDESFYQKMFKFVHTQQAKYWGFQKLIKENLEDHNVLHAGSAYGHLLQAVANSD